MFIIRFGGGLGNQLFQYAFSIYLRHLYPEQEVLYDAGGFLLENEHNGFDLIDYFHIDIKSIDSVKLKSIVPSEYYLRKFKIGKNSILSKLIRTIIKNNRNKNNVIIIKDSPVGSYDRGIEHICLQKSYHYYFSGNWQNIKYYENIQNIIRDKMVFKVKLNDHEMQYQNNIRETRSVCIHFRRGDYVNSRFDLCTIQYYKTAYGMLKKLVGDELKFYVFSDDLEQATSMVGFIDEDITFVQTRNCGIDLYLMSQCKYYIIANSTFSFWAAFLNQCSDKIVIAPEYCYLYNEMYYKFSVPEDWITVDNINIKNHHI